MSQQEIMLQFYVLNKASESAALFDPGMAKALQRSLSNYMRIYEAKGGQPLQ